MNDEQIKPKKKGKKLLLILLGTAVVGGGAAGAVYARNSGLIGGHSAAGHDIPHLVPRDGVSAAEVARNSSPDGDRKVEAAKFQPTYHALGETITANLRDGGSFVQLGLGVSTYYDGRVAENVKLHEMAIRSAMLLTLSDQDPAVISTPAGKESLKEALRTAINDVLKKKEGFAGIDEVHFTSFVIQ